MDAAVADKSSVSVDYDNLLDAYAKTYSGMPIGIHGPDPFMVGDRLESAANVVSSAASKVGLEFEQAQKSGQATMSLGQAKDLLETVGQLLQARVSRVAGGKPLPWRDPDPHQSLGEDLIKLAHRYHSLPLAEPPLEMMQLQQVAAGKAMVHVMTQRIAADYLLADSDSRSALRSKETRLRSKQCAHLQSFEHMLNNTLGVTQGWLQTWGESDVPQSIGTKELNSLRNAMMSGIPEERQKVAERIAEHGVGEGAQNQIAEIMDAATRASKRQVLGEDPELAQSANEDAEPDPQDNDEGGDYGGPP